jgi:type II secretory pathway component GspD/PulD (secretin)
MTRGAMRIVIIAFAASVAFGQTTRVFRLTQNESKQELEEIATVLREAAEVQQVSIDEMVSSVAVEGTVGQVALAEWLLRQIDLPANGPFSGVHEYRPPGGGDDVVRVLYASHASTMEQVQEIASAVQMLAHFQKGFRGYNKLNALVVRGTDQQVSLAAWLVDQLDNPANVADSSTHEYKVADDDVARVFFLSHAQALQQLHEIGTIIRSVGDVTWVTACSDPHAIVMRNRAERVALAAWLVNELDKPTSGHAINHGGIPPEFQLSDDPENLVRVYYLAGSQSEEAYQKVIDQVRRAARTYRSFIYTALGALVVRGSAGQLALAEKVIEEMKAQ